MTEQIRINRAPCASCPYRRDVPSGIWSTEEYDKILPYDNATWVQPPRVFMCHQADGCLCRGWLDVHGGDLLGVRLGCAKGELDPQAVSKALDEDPATPVFASAAEAAKHGRRAIKRPGRKAREMVSKLERKRGKQCKSQRG